MWHCVKIKLTNGSCLLNMIMIILFMDSVIVIVELHLKNIKKVFSEPLSPEQVSVYDLQYQNTHARGTPALNYGCYYLQEHPRMIQWDINSSLK